MRTIFKLYLIFFLLIGIHLHLSSQITPWEAVPQMQKGINLGNTLEPPMEGDWNNPPAEEYYFDLYKNAGFQTVRVPVRWDEHTQTSSPYQIDESWLQRVEEVLDWGLERDLFIVVNAHHDSWIKENYDSAEYRARFDSIWAQVSRRFRDKPDKLIFEILNEPHGLTKEQNDEMHARILTIIRDTNPTRLVIIQGHNWGGSEELIQAAIPDDKYIIGSFHSYDPSLFGLEGQGAWGSSYDFNTLRNKFISVKNWSDDNNIPVFLGEFGAINDCEYNSRMRHYQAYVRLSLVYGFVFCAWDDGGDFRIMERQQKTWNEIKDIIIYTSGGSPGNFRAELYQDTIVKLSWKNILQDFDSIAVQRRTILKDFKKVASLFPQTEEFYDVDLLQNLDYYYRLAVYKNGEKLLSQPFRIFLPKYTPKVRVPFYGYSLPIPGTIEAEDFDRGGEGLTYHDSDNRNVPGDYRPDDGVDIFDVNGTGFHVGGIVPGEWMEYTVVVAEECDYILSCSVAAVQNGGNFTISVGDSVSGVLTALSSSSWLETREIITTMRLAQGKQIMRINIQDDPIFNIDKIVFDADITDFILYSGKNNNFKLYPVRVNEIKFEYHEKLDRINLYSLYGKLLMTSQNINPGEVITTSGVKPGIYLIRAFSGSEIFCSKIFLQ